MERILFLVCVVAAVGLGALAALPSGTLAWVLFAAAVAAFGLPHGALDTRVAEVRLGLTGAGGLAAFVLAYVGLAAGVAGLWLLAPVAGLIAFLGYAAFHFGQDWTERALPAAVFGAAVVALPAWRFEPEVAAIFAALTGGGAEVAAALHAMAPFALAAALMLAVRRPGALLEIGGYALLAAAVPPLFAFAIYFTALHSPRHFRETCADLGCRRRDALASAVPYAAAAGLAGAAAAGAFVAAGTAVPDALARAVFVGLACLTVPHMVLEAVAERPAVAGRVRRAVQAVRARSTRSGVAGASRGT